MKMLFFVLFTVSLFGSGCDYSMPAKINDQKQYILKTECAEVHVNISTFGRLVLINSVVSGNGIVLNIDSLRVLYRPESLNGVKRIYYQNDTGKPDDVKRIEVNGSRKVGFTIEMEKLVNDGQLIIAPCNFITCNGVPLITDTIRINR
jgi:hypothetical protein